MLRMADAPYSRRCRETARRARGTSGGGALVGQWRRPAEAGDLDLTKRGNMIPIPEDCGLAAWRDSQPPALPPPEKGAPTLP